MLLAVTLLSGLLVLWVAVTLVFLGVWIYQTTLTLHEEENLFIDEGEAHLVKAQAETFAKLDRVRPYLVGSASASLAVGVVAAGVWLYNQLTFVH